MSTKERDSHFAGFAALLYSEISKTADDYAFPDKTEEDYLKAVKQLIARCVYDFMVSSHHSTSTGATWEESRERVASVPDLTAWPKPDEHPE